MDLNRLDLSTLSVADVLAYSRRVRDIEDPLALPTAKLPGLLILCQKLLGWFTDDRAEYSTAFRSVLKQKKATERKLREVRQLQARDHRQTEALRAKLRRVEASLRPTDWGLVVHKVMPQVEDLVPLQDASPAYIWHIKATAAARLLQRVWRGHVSRRKFFQAVEALVFGDGADSLSLLTGDGDGDASGSRISGAASASVASTRRIATPPPPPLAHTTPLGPPATPTANAAALAASRSPPLRPAASGKPMVSNGAGAGGGRATGAVGGTRGAQSVRAAGGAGAGAGARPGARVGARASATASPHRGTAINDRQRRGRDRGSSAHAFSTPPAARRRPPLTRTTPIQGPDVSMRRDLHRTHPNGHIKSPSPASSSSPSPVSAKGTPPAVPTRTRHTTPRARSSTQAARRSRQRVDASVQTLP